MSAIAQISFRNASTNLSNQSFTSWLQKGVADMNNDNKDDIVVANQQGYFFILLQQNDGKFKEVPLGQIQSTTPLSIILGDVDNNGYNDILTGGQYNGVRLAMANSDASSYSIVRLPDDAIFTQASSLVDIDNNGWLDIFVCNDDSTNAIWRNVAGKSFFRDSMGFDFSSVPLNKHSGNYGIVFTDFDNDGDLDAYLSKCKSGVEDSTDQRRINQLFVNNKGIYTDQAKKFGMADSSQTWITEFQDIDNDGDMDAFIANMHAPSRLMLNNGKGYFTDITAKAGLLSSMPDGILQALMRDFDNDGYVDLLVSGMQDAALYKNNGNATFTKISSPLLTTNANPLRSFATGDLNNDGFLDIYASYLWGTKDPDLLWLNEKNANNYIKIKLNGTTTNRSAIGSKIVVYTGNQKQIREIRAGESYGISNSLYQIVGIGQNSVVDKIEVQWASGKSTQLNNVNANTFIEITENLCNDICIEVSPKLKR